MHSPANLAGNVRFHSLHVPKLGWLRTGYQGCIRAVRRKLAEMRPDIVHGQGTERECAISAVFSGFPNVVTIHGNMVELARLFRPRVGSYGWFAAKLENFTLRRTGGVFCNSAYTESLIRPRARKVWRVSNPLRSVFFEPPLPDAKTALPCLILNVGVISPRKRQVEILGLARELLKQGFKFQLEFIGHADRSDAYARRFFEELSPLEAAGCAKFAGLLQAEQLSHRFDEASALLHFPSEEAFGLVVAEALARDMKFFGAAVGGIKDITAGVPDVDLFEPGNWTGLIAAMRGWMQQGHPRSTGASRLMRERYHPGVIAQQHVEIYREVLNTRS